MKLVKELGKRTKAPVTMIAILIIVLSFFGFLLNDSNAVQTYYSDVMKTLGNPKTKEYMLTELNGTNDIIDLLFVWEQNKLTWANGPFTRYSEPRSILQQGIGKCEEYSIIFVAACLALGYEARLLVSRQFYLAFIGLHGFHAWAEVKIDGAWIQVDPSPTPFWNDTSRYKSWPWGPRRTLNVLAFECGRIDDVSSRYR
jgi:hypothetical protein